MSKRIAIIGAGIGGLTLAIDLQRKGLDVRIYEQTAVLREVGAAVALSANATRFYEGRFGLAGQLAKKCALVDGLIFRDGRTGERIARLSSREDYRARYGAPYTGIHRADLQAILFGALDPDSLHLRKRVVDIDDTGSAARLSFADGDHAEADLVIGADVARSLTRRLLLGYDDARYSGCSAARGIVAPELLPSLPDPEAIQFWMGPGGHLLHYPIGNGDQNFFLVKRESLPWTEKGWVVPAEDEAHIEPFADWAPAVIEMISAWPGRKPSTGTWIGSMRSVPMSRSRTPRPWVCDQEGRRAHRGARSGLGPTPTASAGSTLSHGIRRTTVTTHDGGRSSLPRIAGMISAACRTRCMPWMTTVGTMRRRWIRANARASARPNTAPESSNGARMRAAATASCTARLIPTPPTGDIACAASPMHSTPGACQRRSRSRRTSRCFTSAMDPIPVTPAAASGKSCAASARKASRPRARTASSAPLGPSCATWM